MTWKGVVNISLILQRSSLKMKRPCGEYKIVVNEPVYKAKTETTEVVIDKDNYKGLGFEYKKEKTK